MKKTLTLLLALVLALSCCSFALAEGADITEGIFDGSFFAEGYGNQENYVHFYPADEHTGKAIFYFSTSGGAMTLAGYYEVTDAALNYNSYANHEDKGGKVNELTGEAPKTVILTSLDGDLLGQVAYDPEAGILYQMNCSGINSGVLGYNYVQDTASGHTAEDENGIAIQRFVSPDDETCFVEIYHNGTYGDYIMIQILGFWSVDETGRIYTLTPEDEDDTAAVLTVSEDGLSASYVNEDGDEMELIKPVAALQTRLYGETDIDVGGGNVMHFYLNLNLYEDGTAEMAQSYAENDVDCEQGSVSQKGTWSADGVVMGGDRYEFAADGSVEVMGFAFASADAPAAVLTGSVTTSYNITVTAQAQLWNDARAKLVLTYEMGGNVLQETETECAAQTMDYNGITVFTGIALEGNEIAIQNSMTGMTADIPVDLSQVGGTAEDVITVELAY